MNTPNDSPNDDWIGDLEGHGPKQWKEDRVC
jgi:hypothetical protein